MDTLGEMAVGVVVVGMGEGEAGGMEEEVEEGGTVDAEGGRTHFLCYSGNQGSVS